MLTFLLTAALGAYAANRISFLRDAEIATATIDYLQIWEDAIAFLTLIGSLCQWSIGLGRKVRSFANSKVIPWLNAQGFSIALPTSSTARPLVKHQ